MTHSLCESCETVAHCLSKGCIPLVTTNDHGRLVDTHKHEAPKARAPITLADHSGVLSEDKPSLLASRWFWIASLVSSLLWVLADVLLSVYWPH